MHWKRSVVLVAVTGVILLLLIGGFYVFVRDPTAVNTPSTPVTMAGLVAAYMDDPSNANSLYANRTYYVTGVPLSVQQNPGTGLYYSDFVLPGFIQLYWQDLSQASRVIPCTDGQCQPILAKCFLMGFNVETAIGEAITMTNCELVH